MHLNLQSEPSKRGQLLVFALCYATFFFAMTRSGFHSWFSEDDFLNTYYCWSRPLSELIRGNIFFWGHYYRPLSELVLYLTYGSVGLNPAVWNLIRFVLCAADVVLLYVFVSRLTRSRETGVFAVILGGFHPAMFSLYFDSGMIYDLLAFLFYYSALSLYVHFRRDGRLPTWLQSAGVLVLYISALNSKEIAVSFPVALLLIELFLFPRTRQSWARLRTVVLAGLLTLIFIIGRNTGAGALSAQDAYHPHVSAKIYLDTYADYAAQYLFLLKSQMQPVMPFVLAGCIVLAILLRNRILLWASIFNLAAILPIAFIPARNAFAFVVPLVGWSIYGAELLSLLRAAVTGSRAGLRAPARLAIVIAICIFAIRPEVVLMNAQRMQAILQEQDRDHDLYVELRALLPTNLSHKRILALNEPFKLGYILLFMIQLGWDDPTVVVDTGRILKEHGVTPSPDRYDFVLDYTDGKFVRVQPAM